jgi:uncharacterized protein (DUF2236 family)
MTQKKQNIAIEFFPENFREKTDLGWHLAKNPT